MDKIIEKLNKYGIKSLTKTELLKASSIKTDVFNKFIENINTTKEKEEEYSFSSSKEDKEIIKCLCISELYRREVSNNKDFRIKSTSDSLPYFLEYADKKQEHFILLTLNGANEVIKKHVITIGLVNSTQIHPREVFTEAIKDRACFIIVAHNHPSGSLEPSMEDIAITQRLQSSGQIIGIKLLDHIIISTKGHCSIMNLIK